MDFSFCTLYETTQYIEDDAFWKKRKMQIWTLLKNADYRIISPNNLAISLIIS